ncbi:MULTISPECIES: hypothetical protein [Mycetohabitans]|uniref:hypothetical protein n=1 Tax=Mycetohabitans TaxID=2571159 RepID=UPI001F4760ED|nr:hypothetical protein [Mycetohabitans sp. B3]MCF2133882.1 hypothetical protein [Mycetohabitans sp. B3]
MRWTDLNGLRQEAIEEAEEFKRTFPDAYHYCWPRRFLLLLREYESVQKDAKRHKRLCDEHARRYSTRRYPTFRTI